MGVVDQLYQDKLAARALQPNAAQARAVALLDQHAKRVVAEHKRFQPPGLLAWLLELFVGEREPYQAQGIYIYGPVGRGKTMVMDLFVEAIKTQSVPVHRTHFHRFFSEVHSDIHRRRTTGQTTKDVMVAIAQHWAKQYKVLAFDEFYVNNIADAMILGRFLGALFQAGVAVVFTSNDAPSDLYPGGLQRERFVPTIELLKNKSEVILVDSGKDYRLSKQRLPLTLFTPLGQDADRFMDQCFSQLSNGVLPETAGIRVDSVRLEIPSMAGDFARFSFAQLCEQPMWNNEYLALAQAYQGLLLDNVPQFTSENFEASERFRVFIDIWYDQKKFLAMSAAAPLEKLVDSSDAEQRLARTISRLIDMQSAGYVSTALNSTASA